jgi:replicative DNA helicase
MDQNNIDKIIPIWDDNCEEYVLGTILWRNNALNECREILDEECFYNINHKAIFNAIKELDGKGEDISIVSVMPILVKHNINVTIGELANISENNSMTSIYQYALRLYELSEKRKLYEMGYHLMKACSSETEDIFDILSYTKNRIETFADKKSDQYIKLETSLKQVTEIVNNNISNTKKIIGTPTGFKKIDERGGLQKGDLIIIAGESSQGKTALALSITLNALEQGYKISYYSMEMQNHQLTSRLVAMKSGISSSSILYDKLREEQISSFDKAIGDLWNKNLFYDDRSTSNIDLIIASIRNMKMKYDIDGAVVDYIQILNVNRTNRSSTDEQLMGDVARRLKNLAKDLNIWIIALSQLNRDKDNPIPTISRLRSSGQIAEAADIVALIYRPEYYQKKFPEPFSTRDTTGTALIDIAKGRNIGTFKFLCRFNAPITFFYDDEHIGTFHVSNNSPF